ncbi:MAG: hypothetical protein JO182_21580 [Acidobacteriaceae bacterium]|nr:hypothetical protein [Acidobacteriaceae bacterium]
MISRNGIELADPRLTLFRTARACVCWQEFTTPRVPAAHDTVHWRSNDGTVERYRPEKQRAMPSFDRLQEGAQPSKTHSLQLRGPV